MFIEIRNDDTEPIDLTGWTLGEIDATPFTFPIGFRLEAETSFRIWGEGNNQNGLAISDIRSNRDRILLIAPSGPDTIIDLTVRSRGQKGVLRPDPAVPGSWISEATQGEDDRINPMGTSDLVGQPPSHSFRIRPCPARSCVDVDLNVVSGRDASVLVLNALGQVVDQLFEGNLVVGNHAWRWCPDELGVSSGVYFIVDTQDPSAGVGRAVIVH